jgi:hypothetical protein
LHSEQHSLQNPSFHLYFTRQSSYAVRYPTLPAFNQNWVGLCSTHHPSGPKSHSAQLKYLIPPDSPPTARENPIFSNCIGEGVTSHHPGGRSGEGSGAGKSGTGAEKISGCGGDEVEVGSCHTPTPRDRMRLAHASRGQVSLWVLYSIVSPGSVYVRSEGGEEKDVYGSWDLFGREDWDWRAAKTVAWDGCVSAGGLELCSMSFLNSYQGS